jgi:hypothetical protein
MRKVLTVFATAALAALVVSSVTDAADARSRGHSASAGARSSPGRSFSGRSFSRSFSGPSRVYSGRSLGSRHAYVPRIHSGSHRRHAGFRGRRLLYGIPLGAYGYYAYTDSCLWLQRRAIATGNPYWWDRYYACLDGNYY